MLSQAGGNEKEKQEFIPQPKLGRFLLRSYEGKYASTLWRIAEPLAAIIIHPLLALRGDNTVQ